MPLADRSDRDARHKQRTSRVDVFAGMAFSNVVMFAIIVSTAATLGAHGAVTITTAAQAAQALKPIAGGLSETLFALGFIGSGMLAIPVLAGSGSVGMAGLLHKEWGFSRSIREAPVFYGLVAVGTIGGTLVTLTGLDPVKLLDLLRPHQRPARRTLPHPRHGRLRRHQDHGRLRQRSPRPRHRLGHRRAHGRGRDPHTSCSTTDRRWARDVKAIHPLHTRSLSHYPGSRRLIGITNLAFARWSSAIVELGIGGGFLVFFSVRWARLNDLRRQRRQPGPPTQ